MSATVSLSHADILVCLCSEVTEPRDATSTRDALPSVRAVNSQPAAELPTPRATAVSTACASCHMLLPAAAS